MVKIPGFVGYYIDEEGNVWSKRRVLQKKLKPWLDVYGYPSVSLSTTNSCYVTRRIHRLMADCFKLPGEGNEINHIDGNKTNNKRDNLEWVTHQANMDHAWGLGLMRRRKNVKD